MQARSVLLFVVAVITIFLFFSICNSATAQEVACGEPTHEIFTDTNWGRGTAIRTMNDYFRGDDGKPVEWHYLMHYNSSDNAAYVKREHYFFDQMTMIEYAVWDFEAKKPKDYWLGIEGGDGTWRTCKEGKYAIRPVYADGQPAGIELILNDELGLRVLRRIVNRYID